MATNNADQVTPTNPNSARSDCQITLQPSHTTTTVTAHHDDKHHPQSSVAAGQHEILHDQSGMMPSGNLRLDSGFGSLHVHQPNSLNYEGGLPSIGANCLPSLDFEDEIDDAYESLQPLQSMGEQFLSMGAFPMTVSPLSMGPLSTMNEFPQQLLPEITESPPSSPDKIDSQAVPGSMHAMQDTIIVGDGPSNPFTSSSASSLRDPNENVALLGNEHDSDENAEMNAQGQSPVHSDDLVSNPQLPSTSLSNVSSRPIEIPLRERVRQNPDYVLERVLVEEKGRSV